MRPVAILLWPVLAMALPLPAAAQWAWRDASGFHAGDQPPPPGTKDSDIITRPAAARRAPALPVAASGALAPRAVEPELEARRKKTEDDASAKRKAEEDKQAAQRAATCTAARNQLRALEEGVRVTRTNAKGEPEFLDDRGRADEMSRTRDLIRSNCG